MSAKVLTMRKTRCINCESEPPMSGLKLCWTCLHLKLGMQAAEAQSKQTAFDKALCITILALLIAATIGLAFWKGN